MGIPDSALTALLVVVATLTIMPYVAGRDFGPYEVPDVLPERLFWTLAMLLPLVWCVLIASLVGVTYQRLRRTLVRLTIAELVAFFLAFGSSTTTVTKHFQHRIPPGTEKVVMVELPGVSRATQRIEINLDHVEGVGHDLGAGAQMGVRICGGDDIGCPWRQLGIGSNVVLRFEKGLVRVQVFNFAQTPADVIVTYRVRHLRRRFL